MSSSEIEPCPFCSGKCFVHRFHGSAQVQCLDFAKCDYRGPRGRWIERKGDWDADGEPVDHVNDDRVEDDAIHRHNAVARRARAMDEMVSKVTR